MSDRSAEAWRPVVDAYGSPAYVYDLADVRSSHAQLCAALPQEASLLYSLKANPHPVLVGQLHELGCGAEVSSLRELEVAAAAGMDLEQAVLYTGPGKSAAELRAALSGGARLFSVDSAPQLASLAAAAASAGTQVRVLLRINPDRGTPGAGLAMTGVPSQFGVDAEQVLAAPGRFGPRPGADVVGLHLYLGSNHGDGQALAAQFEGSLEVASRVCDALRLSPEVLDLGGGFGRAYARHDEVPELSGLREAITTAVATRFSSSRDGGPRLVFESGRFLVASCGSLIATVVDVKRSKGKTFAVLDSGVHHLGGMPALGRIPRMQPVLDAPPVVPGAAPEPVDVVGPLCTPLDWWRRAAQGPLREGQLVAVPNVGAYGLTASLVAFLSREFPVEVVLDGDEVVHVSRLSMERHVGWSRGEGSGR